MFDFFQATTDRLRVQSEAINNGPFILKIFKLHNIPKRKPRDLLQKLEMIQMLKI